MKRLLCFVGLLHLALTYDTGHHADLTRNAMEIHGYNQYSQQAGAVFNWFIDYYSYTPLSGQIADLKSMHFDNLFHMVNVSNYMTQLIYNTMNATRFAVSQNDPLTYLAVMGASLHAIQDFYTHSSWAEHHQTSCGCYRDDTWFSDLAAANGSVAVLFDRLQAIRTYSWGNGCNYFERNCLPGQQIHGDYCEGVNKDSYVRPWFERSYGHAMAASIEWIYNLQLWANEAAGNTNLVDAAKAYTPSGSDVDDLQSVYQASVKVSAYTKTPSIAGEEDGHYKGSGSGDLVRLAAFTVKFEKSSSIYTRKFTDEHVYQYLTNPNLYDVANYENHMLNQSISAAVDLVVPYTSLPASLTQLRKIKLRTVSLSCSKRVGRPSPYALVTMDNLQFIEAVQINQGSLNPHWTSIKYVPIATSTVNVKYELWDDQFPGTDDAKSIIGDSDGNLNFVYDLDSQSVTGDVTGSYNANNATLNVTNDGNFVQIYIMTEQAGNCVLQGLPEPYCPNEAYTELRTYSSCDYQGNGSRVNGAANINGSLWLTIISSMAVCTMSVLALL